MKKTIIFLFCTILLIKILLIPLVTVPLGYSDSLAYMEQAKVFFDTSSISKVLETAKFPPLYAIIISPAYIFQDMTLVFLLIKIINAILSTLIIFPVYFLAREFLEKKKSLWTAAIISFVPIYFAMTFYALSENLFFLLFLTTIYFLLKSFTQYKTKYFLLSGIGIGLCILTRFSAVVLLAVVGTIILIKLFQKEKKAMQGIYTLFIALSILLPLCIFRGLTLGWSFQGIFLGYTAEATSLTQGSFLLQKIIWFIIYSNYLTLSVGILVMILTLQLLFKYTSLDKKEKTLLELTCVTTLGLLFIAANNSGNVIPYTDHRVLGRYITTLIPLLILLSIISLQKFKKISKKATIITALSISLITPFLLFGLFFPINNAELIHIELLKMFLSQISFPITITITILLTGITLFFLYKRKISLKTYMTLLFLYFITISLLNTAAIIYDAQQRWEPLEEVQMGIWITKNIHSESTFFFDENSLEVFEEGTTKDRTDENDRPLTVIAYWIRGEIINQKEILNSGEAKKTETDYLLTEEQQGQELIHQEGDLYLYKND